MYQKLNTRKSQLIVIICAFFIFLGHVAEAKAGEPCGVVVRKEQSSSARTVFLAGGNAWDLFQRYLSEAAKQQVDLSLWKARVFVSNGKERQEFSLKWTNMLVGQGAKEVWEGRLKGVKAELDEAVLNDASQQQWDIVCISPNPTSGQAQQQLKTAKPNEQSTPASLPQGEIPTEAKQNFQQGLQFAARGDFNNAIKEFTVAIKKYPSYSIAYSNRGAAYMQQKKFNLAEDDMKKAIEFSPKDPIVNYNLTALYSLQKEKLDRALIYLDTALTNGFNDYDALRKDPDLANLRKHPDWRKTLEKHKVFLGEGK